MPLYRALYYSGCHYTGPPTVIKSTVTGQAPVTLQWKNTQGMETRSCVRIHHSRRNWHIRHNKGDVKPEVSVRT